MSDDANVVSFDFPKDDSPNKDIDEAIRTLMRQVRAKGDKALPPDVAVKVINAAISWEKVKHGIKDKDTDFDPDA